MAEQNQEISSEGKTISEAALLQLINHCKSEGNNINIQEISKTNYMQITPVQNRIYFVYDDSIDYKFAHTIKGTSYKYSDVSDTEDTLAVLESLNNVIYAGFTFNINTRVSTIMSASEIENFASKLDMDYVTDSNVTITQDSDVPTIHWVNGTNNDTLYLDATTISNVGTKCGYSGCTSHLFYNVRVYNNSIYLNGKMYSKVTL